MSNKRSPTPLDKKIGLRVLELRQELGWTQERLGEAMGVSTQQAQKYEKGRDRIPASRLYALSVAAGRGADWFFPSWEERAYFPDDIARETLSVAMKQYKETLDALEEAYGAYAALLIETGRGRDKDKTLAKLDKILRRDVPCSDC